MDNLLLIKQSLLTMLSGLFVFLFGVWDGAFQVLVTFIVLDYITGVMDGYVTNNLNSKDSFRGIVKKIATLITVAIAVLVDRAIGVDCLRMATILCLIGNEGISIVENLGKLGVPIPKKIINALVQLKTFGDEEEENKGEVND